MIIKPLNMGPLSVVGGYCPDNGMSQPLPCPPGWSSAPGQTHCRSCNDTSLLCGGAVAPRWNQPLHRSSQPITCRPGTYKDTREELACVICPIGLCFISACSLVQHTGWKTAYMYLSFFSSLQVITVWEV